MVRRRWRREARRSALALLVAQVAIAGCVEPPPPGDCGLPAELVSAVNAPASSNAALAAALEHAAGPMMDALGTPTEVESLREAVLSVATSVQNDADGACRLLTFAAAKLDSLPNTPETLPDRDGIRMVLALAARTLNELPTQ